MKMRFIAIILTCCSLSFAQENRLDTGEMIEYKNPFWEKIKESSSKFRSQEKEPKRVFKMNFEGLDLPEGVEEFKTIWHQAPISQGWTGTCWAFSTTSFLESECFRLNGKKIKLSEIHTAYWEYVEKAREFVRTRGESLFAEGSEDNAVIRMWKQYGCVPAEAYSGVKEGQDFHDHSVMFDEMKSFLKSMVKQNAWNEQFVLDTIKNIMNHHMGAPPSTFQYEGKEYTPVTFLSQVVHLNPDDYVDFISLKSMPYYTKGVYDVPDNWWHSNEYYNVPLDVFMGTLKKALKEGFSICLGGDTSESGYHSKYDVAVIPSYDIPSEYINEDARQFRFSNGTTTDDHGIHLVGFREYQGQNWYLIKDSGSGSRNGNTSGYYFYHEDYIKLKMMNFLVHRSAVEDLLKEFE